MPEKPPATRDEGVVVIKTDPGMSGERSGVKEGDLLLSWKWVSASGKQRARGAISGSVDKKLVETVLLSSGKVTLLGTRGGEPLELVLKDGEPGISTRPDLEGPDREAKEKALTPGPGGGPDPSALAALAEGFEKRGLHGRALDLRFEAAEAAAKAKNFDESQRILEGAVAGARENLSPERSAMALNHAGALLVEFGDPARSRPFDERALEEWAKLPFSAGRAYALARLAESRFRSGDLKGAWDGFSEASAEYEAKAPGCYLGARAEARLGEILWARGKTVEALERFRKAHDNAARVVSGGMELIGFLNNIGKVLFRMGDLLGAETIFRQSVALQEKNVPGSLELARSLNGLGLVVTETGDLPEAERILREATAIWDKVSPGNPNAFRSYSNLGNVYLHRGDLARAEECYSKSLEMVRLLAPGSLQETAPLGNLASVAMNRGDFDTAAANMLEVLKITEKEAPGSPDLARCYEHIASLEFERGRYDSSFDYSGRGISILREKSPGSVQLGRALKTFGNNRLSTGKAGEAVPLLEEARRIFEAVNPASIDSASVLTLLSQVALEQGDTAASLEHGEKAVAIHEAQGIVTQGLVAARAQWAQALRAAGRKAEARAQMELAMGEFESLRGRAGGSSEDRSSFLAIHADLFCEFEELLLEMGEPAQAFRTVERWRASEFLKLLASRDLDLSSQVPPELERERRVAIAELARAESELAGDNPPAPEEREALEIRARAARKRLEDVRSRTLDASRSVYDLRYPRPAGVEETLSALDEGTLLLEYSLSPKRAVLYAFGPGKGEFSAHALRCTGTEIAREVERFRGLIRESAATGDAVLKLLRSSSSSLSEKLLGPVEGRVERSERVLVVPDGALHYLPFSALEAPSARGKVKGKGFAYLVEAKPVHMVASATVYSRLLPRRGTTSAAGFEAFGDPDYGKSLPGSAWRGGPLTPLPGTRAEVDSLRAELGQGKVRLGPDATSAAALAVPRDTRIVHFACHGFADEQRPLESALALSPAPGGGDDGMLQAWEICESLRVDADLVTLSACETGLGKVMRGEGLVGLTRAFQFAGARTVLASLWPVDDASTAELMRGFYSAYKEGKTKDEALRSAQLRLLGKGRASTASPYFWAAFELVGDWH